MMKLTDLIQNSAYTVYPETAALHALSVSDIAYNSKKAGPDILFVCRVGAAADGHDFAADAYARGSRIFVCEKKLPLPPDTVQLITENTRRALASLSAELFRHPERKLRVIGVTGTKGKSTICEMARHILTENGIRAASVGTVGVRIGDTLTPTGNTTPESYELYRIFSDMVERGIEYAVIEVSSQGIKLDRIFGIPFFAAVMTNLSEDHIGLHEHPDFDDYKRCKMALFHRCEVGIFNADDTYFEEFTEQAPCRKITYSITPESGASDFTAHSVAPILTPDGGFGVSYTVRHAGERADAVLPFPGAFSVYNALAAIAIGALAGIPLQSSAMALRDVAVNGRFEIVKTPLPAVTFVIDYAHNGESLAAALTALRAYRPRRLVCLFGSVGGRTEIRRRELGIAAAEYADFSILTSDNPDAEAPRDIIRDIERHMTGASYIVIPDRREAIEYAVGNAKAGDVVLLAGKGHEAYQLINGKKYPFSERDILLEAAARLKGSVGVP